MVDQKCVSSMPKMCFITKEVLCSRRINEMENKEFIKLIAMNSMKGTINIEHLIIILSISYKVFFKVFVMVIK